MREPEEHFTDNIFMPYFWTNENASAHSFVISPSAPVMVVLGTSTKTPQRTIPTILPVCRLTLQLKNCVLEEKKKQLAADLQHSKSGTPFRNESIRQAVMKTLYDIYTKVSK